MSTWTMGKKLATATTASVAATLLLGAVAVVSSHSLGRAITTAYEHDAVLLAYSHEIQIHLQAISTGLGSATLAKLAGNEAGARNGLREAEQARTKLEEVIKATQPMLAGREEQRALAALQEHLASWRGVEQPIVTALINNQSQEALRLLNTQAAEAVRKGVAAMELFEEAIDADNARAEQAAIAQARTVFWITLLLACVGLAAAASSGYAGRSATQRLRRIVGELTSSAEEVAGMSRQVSQSAQGLADGVSGQAASLEETSASAEEMNAVTQQNALRCQQASDLATDAQKGFEYTNNALAKMVDAMAGITASSDEISKIIKVIDEIAFQTNILALNAAVEAARAGEAGMGFAVVADEVRNLAQRSAQAARDTTGLIEESISRAADGSRKLGHVSKSIVSITEYSKKVKVLAEEVSTGSAEQARGISEIARTLRTVEQATQRGQMAADQTQDAGQQLSGQAVALDQTIQQLAAMVGGVRSSDAHVFHSGPEIAFAGAQNQ
jgi:methyl-accepting chemotaxis protein